MTKIDFSLSPYDVSMFNAGIALMRRYGDNQIHDWAGDMRDRLNEALELALSDNAEDEITSDSTEASE